MDDAEALWGYVSLMKQYSTRDADEKSQLDESVSLSAKENCFHVTNVASTPAFYSLGTYCCFLKLCEGGI